MQMRTLSGNFAYEKEAEGSENIYNLTNASSTLNTWERNEVTDATNPKWQYELVYKKDFKNHKEHELLFSTSGRFFGKNQSSTYNDFVTLGAMDDFSQKTNTLFDESQMHKIRVTLNNPNCPLNLNFNFAMNGNVLIRSS
mgnify:CR=1 FL=1